MSENPTDVPSDRARFATVPAAQLRVGDLIHRPRPDGGHGYVLVARADLAEDLVQLMLYDSEHPQGAPATLRPDEQVLLACRDLIEPDDGLSAWTDARWQRAHRRGAAFALIEQIHARSIGPVVAAPGDGIEDEIDRIRGRDPLPPRTLRAAELADLLGAARVEKLDLDVAVPAVRAVLALLVRIKAAEHADGSWNGGDVVATLTGWFDELGIDPQLPAAALAERVVTTARPTASQRPDGGGLDYFTEIDLDRVAELVRAAGVDCVIDTPGGGVAVLLAGPPATEPSWAFPWEVRVGPGRFCWDAPATGSLGELRIGPDIPAPTAAVLLRELGVETEAQVADAVLTRARLGPVDTRGV